MACSKDSKGEGGQQILKTVLNITASFSDELLARRCGISGVVFEGGCVILGMFWRQQMQKTRMYRNVR